MTDQLVKDNERIDDLQNGYYVIQDPDLSLIHIFGLSIVKKILEDHGGKVWATSRLGIGTIMYFVLRKYQEVPMK